MVAGQQFKKKYASVDCLCAMLPLSVMPLIKELGSSGLLYARQTKQNKA